MPRALVVEDDPASSDALVDWLNDQGFDAVEHAASLEEARAIVDARALDLVLLDLDLPDGRGLALLEPLEAQPDAAVVVVTGQGTMNTAVEALRAGVIDYLTKPIDLKVLGTITNHVRRAASLRAEVTALRDELRQLGRFKSIIGAAPSMQRTYNLISKVAPTPSTVLILGETGVGKEIVAQTLHDLSPRAEKPFVAVNCGAVPAELIESSLFGHEKGSFTGASKRHPGYFEQANGGTLLLDEITEMPIELQIRLLRVLETRQIMRVGSDSTIDVDVRVVAATNRDPQGAVADGKLREDLYYRLNVFPIEVPPLRERDGDVRLLAEHFLSRLNEANGSSTVLTAEALERLEARRWPGNVRELKNVIERLHIVAGDRIEAEHVELEDGGPSGPPSTGATPERTTPHDMNLPVGSTIKDVERQLILATLEHHDGNKQRTADVLGISLKTLYNRLNRYQGS